MYLKSSNASTFRAFNRIDRQMTAHVMPKTATGDRPIFVFRSDRVGTVVATHVGGTRLVKQQGVSRA